MAESINCCTFTGNVVRDAELVRSRSGLPILKFSLAVPGTRRDPDTGFWVDWPNFLEMKLFGPRAEALFGRLVKGQRIAVMAEARYVKWADKATGANRSRIEFEVKQLVFMTGRDDAPQPGAPAPATGAYFEEDVSF